MQEQKIASDITILGHFAKDVIQIDGKSINALGGAVYYGGIAASHMGLKVTILTKLHKRDFELLNIFNKQGINCIAFPSQETSGIKNVYRSSNMESRTYEPLGFAGPFLREEIPEINTKVFVLGPIIAGEISLELLDGLSQKFKGCLAMDIQGFIRGIKNKKMTYFNLTEKEQLEIISKVDFLKLDQTETEILTKSLDLSSAGKKLLNMGPREIIITHKNGINLYTAQNQYFFPWKNKLSMGRTGRGDTAFISYLGSRLTKEPVDSLLFAAALTSLKMEFMGPFSLPLWHVEELIKKEYN